MVALGVSRVRSSVTWTQIINPTYTEILVPVNPYLHFNHALAPFALTLWLQMS